jgi:hypothetical protein
LPSAPDERLYTPEYSSEKDGMPKSRIDMTGLRFGRLCGLAFDHRSASGHAYWRFACDCGTQVVAAGHNVRAGRTTSCGCLHREISAARLTDHGQRAQRRQDATYRAWQGMKRETRPADVCALWADHYDAFLADMGERPDAAILTRLDTTQPYRRGNCAWTMRDARAERARTGWASRRARADQLVVERAATSQSTSSPRADDIMWASTRR